MHNIGEDSEEEMRLDHCRRPIFISPYIYLAQPVGQYAKLSEEQVDVEANTENPIAVAVVYEDAGKKVHRQIPCAQDITSLHHDEAQWLSDSMTRH